ncbi:replicative helicase loader/inhibitor [Bacillus safensis]|uniref:replicative helicase loader/inhibitor n=1 Tax=Bacillus safensis TaxID=561879 RepID=UPI0024BFB595|nr:replicative helicase loader/inhibitor [Bacillus safensis]WHX74676.1 replicative helicase loader/inhibitor [Bacillus safensis]WHX82134.1 replicative helicase loader/inhibitor [Bacillus safensis]
MTKAETLELLKLIKTYYEHFEVDQSKLDAWAKILKPENYERIEANLIVYVKNNQFPPKVSDLLNQKERYSRSAAIPNVEETQSYLSEIERAEPTEEEQEKIEQHKAAIRKVLGIGEPS